MGESTHHLLWPRAEYRTRHEKALRRTLVIETEWESHRELHAALRPPVKPDIGITLTLLDHFGELEMSEPAPLYAIDRLLRLGNQEAVALADHFVAQLGYLGVGYGRAG